MSFPCRCAVCTRRRPSSIIRGARTLIYVVGAADNADGVDAAAAPRDVLLEDALGDVIGIGSTIRIRVGLPGSESAVVAIPDYQWANPDPGPMRMAPRGVSSPDLPQGADHPAAAHFLMASRPASARMIAAARAA